MVVLSQIALLFSEYMLQLSKQIKDSLNLKRTSRNPRRLENLTESMEIHKQQIILDRTLKIKEGLGSKGDSKTLADCLGQSHTESSCK